MTLNDLPEIRSVLDRARGEALALEKDNLLRRMGYSPAGGPAKTDSHPGSAKISGLLVWYFGGVTAKCRDPREIPLPKIKEFARYYTSIAA